MIKQVTRDEMVENQIRSRGIINPAILACMRDVPRHVFVPDSLQDLAYADAPLPIGHNQTISQPYIVALMAQQLNCHEFSRVLDIGTGSGYAAAVLSRIVKEVYSIEFIEPLAKAAIERFHKLSYTNIFVKTGNGNMGWLEHAPFDAIHVAAASSVIPKNLLSQLKNGGYLVIPIGGPFSQMLKCYHKIDENNIVDEDIIPVRFVPLINS